jgi:hypothetical protein
MNRFALKYQAMAKDSRLHLPWRRIRRLFFWLLPSRLRILSLQSRRRSI